MVGMFFVSLFTAASAAVPSVMSRSGDVATNFAAYLRNKFSSPSLQRYSRSTFCPVIHPSACRPDSSATRSARDCGSLSGTIIKSPIRRLRPGCCARAASGHPAAAPPTSVMNSRRLTGRPLKQRALPYHAVGCIVHRGNFWLPMSALGQKRTLELSRGMSALVQKRTSECARAMSALPPKADIKLVRVKFTAATPAAWRYSPRSAAPRPS